MSAAAEPTSFATLRLLLQPGGLVGLLLWCFIVLSAVQLTVRLIMAFSVRTTFVGSVALAALALLVSVVYDLALGPAPTFSTRLSRLPLAMLLMGLAGFAVARWVLRFRRLRGQIVAAIMVGLLDPHLFTLLSSV